jgi:hypothetical protein
MKGTWILLLVLAPLAAYAEEAEAFPFDQYPVTKIYRGKPAAARPVSKRAHEFRTAIRDGAKAGPNFAGHYTVVSWGCGSSCFQLAVVDAITGRVYDAPFSVMTYPLSVEDPLHYRVNSSLLVLQGCPEEDNCATRFYRWDNGKLTLLSTTPLPAQSQ